MDHRRCTIVRRIVINVTSVLSSELEHMIEDVLIGEGKRVLTREWLKQRDTLGA